MDASKLPLDKKAREIEFQVMALRNRLAEDAKTLTPKKNPAHGSYCRTVMDYLDGLPNPTLFGEQ